MKRIALSLVLLVLILGGVSAQVIDWNRTIDSGDFDIGRVIVADTDNNVYVYGDTRGGLFTPNNGPPGTQDLFIAKYGPNGVPDWNFQIGTPGSEAITDMVIDSLNDIYILGRSDGDFGGPGTGPGNFLAKFDHKTGDMDWNLQFDFGGISWGMGIDEDDKIFVVGANAWMTKYNSSGSLLWNQQFTPLNSSVNDVVADNFGSIYIIGTTDACFGGLGSCSGDWDAFLAKFDAVTGVMDWNFQFGTADYDYPGGVAVDASGNVYVLGGTQGAFPGYSNPDNYERIFVTKVSSSGSQLWLKQLSPEMFDANILSVKHEMTSQTQNPIHVDSTDSIYGTFILSETIWSSPEDTVVVTFDASGNLTCSARIGKLVWRDWAHGFNLDNADRAYLVGELDPPGGGLSARDAFVMKLLSFGDTDGDNYCDYIDVCPATFNPGQDPNDCQPTLEIVSIENQGPGGDIVAFVRLNDPNDAALHGDIVVGGGLTFYSLDANAMETFGLPGAGIFNWNVGGVGNTAMLADYDFVALTRMMMWGFIPPGWPAPFDMVPDYNFGFNGNTMMPTNCADANHWEFGIPLFAPPALILAPPPIPEGCLHLTGGPYIDMYDINVNILPFSPNYWDITFSLGAGNLVEDNYFNTLLPGFVSLAALTGKDGNTFTLFMDANNGSFTVSDQNDFTYWGEARLVFVLLADDEEPLGGGLNPCNTIGGTICDETAVCSLGYFSLASNTERCCLRECISGADLIVKNIFVLDPLIPQGETVPIVVTVKNIGLEPAGPFSTLLTVEDPETVLGVMDVNGLDVNEEATLTFMFDSTAFEELITFEAEADVQDTVTENDEKNNTNLLEAFVKRPIEVQPGGGAGQVDLLVLNVKVDQEEVIVGEDVKVMAIVTNAGDQPADDFTVGLYIDSIYEPVVLERVIPTLSAGQSTEVNFTLKTLNLPETVRLVLFTDSSRKIVEANEENNTGSTVLKILGETMLIGFERLVNVGQEQVFAVSDADGAAIQGAVVEIVLPFKDRVRMERLETGEFGTVSFLVLEKGSYAITVSKPGYYTVYGAFEGYSEAPDFVPPPEFEFDLLWIVIIILLVIAAYLVYLKWAAGQK